MGSHADEIVGRTGITLPEDDVAPHLGALAGHAALRESGPRQLLHLLLVLTL